MSVSSQAQLESVSRSLRAAEAEAAAAAERLAASVAREERACAEGEAVRRELTERLWDAEQRAR